MNKQRRTPKDTTLLVYDLLFYSKLGRHSYLVVISRAGNSHYVLCHIGEQRRDELDRCIHTVPSLSYCFVLMTSYPVARMTKCILYEWWKIMYLLANIMRKYYVKSSLRECENCGILYSLY